MSEEFKKLEQEELDHVVGGTISKGTAFDIAYKDCKADVTGFNQTCKLSDGVYHVAFLLPRAYSRGYTKHFYEIDAETGAILNHTYEEE